MSVQKFANSTDVQCKSGPKFDLVQSIVRMLEALSVEDQLHVLKTVSTWLRLTDALVDHARHEMATSVQRPDLIPNKDDLPFSGRPEASPKEFLLDKEPKTDVERLACLAYYLTHYRNQPYFKTEDLSRLNIEAAQRSLSNPSFTAKNAWRDGFFVAAPKRGWRQLSALGEQYVQALPNHEAARALRKRMLSRRASTSRSRRTRNHGASDVD